MNQQQSSVNDNKSNQELMFEQKLSLLMNSNSHLTSASPPPRVLGSNSTINENNSKNSRLRALSTGSSGSSFEINSAVAAAAAASGGGSRLLFTDPFEEKLATTGNIFEKRDEWSVLSRVPISKQNTVHIRLEDEGPYGNDETRCFVLSHFSSLGIKKLNCVFCSADLVVYDRFPLIDGKIKIKKFDFDV